MKIELVKETNVAKGETWYHITKDGVHVDNTYTKSLEKAEEMFNGIQDNGGKIVISTTLRSLEV